MGSEELWNWREFSGKTGRIWIEAAEEVRKGGDRPVKWRRTDEALTIRLPDDVKKDDLAYAFRIRPEGELDMAP